jgi:hypothetical protein
MLSSTELAAIRATQQEALPDTCVVQSRAYTPDGQGGLEGGDWQDGTRYACRLSSRGLPREYLEMSAISGAHYWMVTLPYDAVVTRENRLKIGDRVMSIVGFASGGAWETAKRAVCVEVD